MNIEEMLCYLGVRTQSKESIELCYKMDLEAFNMMACDDNQFINERYIYTCVYQNLLDELGYKKLDKETKDIVLLEVSKINTDEVDKEYRDKHFTGLERILLRYGRYDLVGYQRIEGASFEGMAKDAYLYEMSCNYEKAIAIYTKLNYLDRLTACLKKK